MLESSHPFYIYFSKIYGERWPALCAALQQDEKQIARINRFSPDAVQRFESKASASPFPHSFWKSAETKVERTAEELLDLYVMDPASLTVALALGVQPGERVLDMCAAPGGKSLVLAEALFASGDLNGELRCNDLSDDRRERLKKVIQQYIPRETRNHVWVTGKDAVQFGLREPGTYDRVLLDAPCSGERHLLENPQAMKEWSPRRTEHLATRQYSLLSGAWLAVKEGGHIVYSTCSISPEENDEIIRKLLKKKKGGVRCLSQDQAGEAIMKSGGEKTEFGFVFLPDRCGFGPLYYSLLEKT